MLVVSDPISFTEELMAAVKALPERSTAAERAVRRDFSHRLRSASPDFVFKVARSLLQVHSQHWHAYEIIAAHRQAFQSVGATELEEFGATIDSWWTVDPFARVLAGPAWLRRQVGDEFFMSWALSQNRWRRRAALVSTVALNMRSQGGYGDAKRTLSICELLINDRDDMVVKALSWALRELVVHDSEAVHNFINKHNLVLSSRVIREVNNKLATGLKHPNKTRNSESLEP